MEKFSLKSLLIIVVVLLIGIVGLFRIQQRGKNVMAGWYNDAWQYRKAITLTNSGTGQTNVYVTLTIGTSDTARFQADAGDLRFTKQNGSLLDYYIVSGAGTSSTAIHVNFDIYPAGASTFYLYYGNSSAPNGFSSTDFTTAASNSSTNLLSEERSQAPIAYWSFDEGVGTSVFDSSSNRITGTFYGSPTWKDEADCVSGKCLNFSGDKMGINIGNTTSQLNITGPISLSVWVKPTSISNLISIINRAGFTGPDNGFSLEIHNGKPIVILNNGRIANSTQKCNQAINANVFSNIYWTRDASNNNKIFIDGKECTYSSSISVTQVDTNTSFGIGSKLNKENLAPYSDYSNRTYGQMYDIGGWGGDDAEVYYYSSGGYNNLAYKKMNKTAGGTGGSYINDYAFFPIQDSRAYIVSSYMKGNRTETLGSLALDVNRDATNDYRTGPSVSVTSSWQKKSWVYNAGVGHSGQYLARNIIYVDTDLPLEVYWSGFKVEDATGTGQTTPSYDFSGNMDEVKIYAYARTATQIKQDYAVGKAKVGGKGAGVAVGKDNTDVGSSPPVAYYNFEEGVGTSVFDRSGNSNNGVLGSGTSAPTWAIGKIGKALNFDGSNDYINAGTSPNFDLTDALTISAWIKLNTLNSFHGIVGKTASIWTDVTYSARINSSNQYSWVTYGTGMNDLAVAGADLNWHHVVYWFSKPIKRIYVDGVQIAETTWNQSIRTNTQNLSIGAYAWGDGFGYLMNGKLDEVKIYNYARTQKQILQDMNAGNPISQKTPIAWYKFDEGYGTIANNSGSIGSTINGTFGSGTSAPTWVTGKNNKGLSFDGSKSYLTLQGTVLDSIGSSGDFSVSAWNYQPSFSSFKAIISNGFGNHGYGRWFVGTSSDHGLISLYGGASSTTYKQITGSKTLNANTWNQITGVYSRTESKIKLYVNGVYDNSTLWDGYIEAYEAGKVEVGRLKQIVPVDFMNGLIDEVKIYNYALSDDEIKLDYNQGAQFVMGKSNQTIGNTTTSLDYCIPGDTTACSPPIAEYKFDEGVGTSAFDTSGNNNSGVWVGTPGTTIGKVGKAANFTGSNSITTTAVTLGNDATINFWINPNSTQNAYTDVFSRHSTDVAAYCFEQYNTTNNKYYFSWGNGGAWTCNATSEAIQLTPNIWQHVTILKTGAQVNYFINGIIQSVGCTGAFSTIAWNSNVLTLGRRASVADRNFSGKLDNFKIYNYARTPAQIAYDYNGGKPIGHWKFDECEGTMINDWSGIGNTGTLVIGAGGSQVSVGTCSIGDTSAWSNGNSGKINSAMSFDGNDDKISIGNPTSLRVASGDFSVTAWLKRSETKCATEAVDKGKNLLCGSMVYGGWELGANGNNLGFVLSDSANSRYQWLNFSSQLNRWYHLVGIKKGNTAYLYVDGKFQTSADVTGYVIDDDANLTLGGNVYWRWTGLIDDVRIYNYALTSEQIKQVYNGGSINFR